MSHNIPHTDAAKAKMSESHLGQHYSPETEFKKGQTPWNKGVSGYSTSWKGHKTPDEIKRKISEAKIGETMGESNPHWKGGKTSYYRSIARKVMEKHLGRKLEAGEIVHHIDGDITNYAKENLKLMLHGEHSTFHNTGRKLSAKTKEKIRQSKKGTIPWNKGRRNT